VQCGYFYWPMSLLLAVAGHVCGDVRYTNLVSLLVASALIAYSKPSRVSFLAGALMLLCPGVFYILINAWIEPQMLMLLAAVVFVSLRAGRFSHVMRFVLIGLLLAEKQYMLLTLPVSWLLIERGTMKDLLRAGVIIAIAAAVIVLPFFFWDPEAFLHSSRALYVNLIRTDSISVLAWLKLRFDVQLRLWVTGVFGVAAALAIACRAQRTPAMFAAGMAFVLTVSFLFSTQAFLNYYFLTLGCLCVAIAAQPAIVEYGAPESPDSQRNPVGR
jgi:hypothetical protein